ncbi:MAG: type II toxin-antitoxin system RelE/ParE family toxin [Planctomycetes bacterium]|nr:type II toxin-antitoxin system RelE/ParE family toxin [Planctomycetota bacterium]
MGAPLYRLLVEDRARKFLLGLAPKQYKQLAARIFLLAEDPRPHDTRPLHGHSGLWAVDQGEFRIVYAILDAERLIAVRRVGKRNDDEVYKGLVNGRPRACVYATARHRVGEQLPYRDLRDRCTRPSAPGRRLRPFLSACRRISAPMSAHGR